MNFYLVAIGIDLISFPNAQYKVPYVMLDEVILV